MLYRWLLCIKVAHIILCDNKKLDRGRRCYDVYIIPYRCHVPTDLRLNNLLYNIKYKQQ